MQDLQRVKKIQKLSNVVGCMKSFQPKNIELLLLVVHIVVIVLSLMNLLIIPWSIIDKSIKSLRIVILTFFLVSVVVAIFNQTARKIRRITRGYYYIIAFCGSILSQILVILNFIFVLVSCILIVAKVKKEKEKYYDHKSILIIDIFNLISMIALFFLWYSAFLIIYARTDESIKEFIEAKMRFFHSQNQKIVNIEQNEENLKNSNNKNINHINPNDDIISTNKLQVNDKQEDKGSEKKEEDNDMSSVK